MGIEVDGLGELVKRATPLLGTPGNPGLLIDAIDNAACGQANALINPVDMSCITRDVFGNPRVDGNGKRDIGAVQISQSPALQVKDHTVDTVTVAWSTVALTNLTGYQVEYRPVGSPSWSDGGQVSGTTLEKQVNGLTPGTRYEFRVTALEPSGPAGWSNVVAETPRAVPGMPPAFGLTRADQTINVSWGAGTAANGSPIFGFLVNFRPAGRVPPATFSSLMLPETATSAALTGLTNGVTYEVEVLAVNGVGAGVKASGTATPVAPPTLSYAVPGGGTWPVGTALTLNPLAGGLIGTGSYRVETGALPAGMALDAATGIISGNPTTPGPVSAVIELTDSATGLFATYLLQFNLTAPPTPPPTLAYPSPVTAQQGSTLVAVSPSVGNLSTVPSLNATYSALTPLPGGLTLDPVLGLVGGTPLQQGKQITTIRVTDNNTGLTADAQIFFNISAAVPVLPPTLAYPSATYPVGTPATVTPTVAGLVGTPSYTLLHGAVPAGMSLNPTSGELTGTPTTPGTTTGTIRVTDGSTGLFTDTDVTLQISAVTPAPTLVYPNPTYPADSPISLTPAVGDVTGTPGFALQSGTLPAGLSLDPGTGIISGTPTTVGVQSVTVRVTDGATSLFGDANVIIRIVAAPAAPTLAYASPASWNQGTTLTLTPQYAHVAGTPLFALVGGSLPAGLNLNPDGTITGTPTSIETTTANIQLTDGGSGSGLSTIAAVTLSIVAPPSPPPTLSYPAVTGPRNQPLSLAPTVGHLTGPASYVLTGGSLPPGMSLDAGTGIIAGTPTTEGTTTGTVQVTDTATSRSTSTAVTITVTAPLLSPTLGYAAPATWNQGTALTLIPTIGNMANPADARFTLQAGSLPVGLSLNPATGVISGTPTTVQSLAATLRLTNISTGLFTETVVPLNIVAPPATPPNLAYPSPVSTPQGQPLTLLPTVGHLTGAGNYSVVGGTLPPGTSLNPATGVISGTPTGQGAVPLTIRVTDAVTGLTADAVVTISISAPAAAPTLAYAAPPSWPRDTPLTLTPTIGQVTGTASYALTGGSLPAGLSLNPVSGVISGVPTANGVSTATILLTDTRTPGPNGQAATTIQISITDPGSSPQLWYPVIQTTVGAGQVSAIPTQSGIPGNAAWSAYGGDSLPPGFTLNPATGVISGAATAAPGRVIDITIQACWGSCNPDLGEVRLAPMQFWIVPSLNYPANTPATAGVPLTINPSVSTLWNGGVFSLAPGSSLPAGLNLNPATGAISGTPQAVGAVVPFMVRYTTGVNVLVPPLQTVESVAQINISSPTISLSYPAISGQIGTFLSVPPTVSGTTGPRLFSIDPGTPLPNGLSLDPATGVISGTPTSPVGVSNLVVSVTDSYGRGTAGVVVTLGSYPISLTYEPARAFIGQRFALSPIVSGVVGTPVFQVSGGLLPDGLVLDPTTGVISGTPKGPAGTVTVNITLTDQYTSTSANAVITLIALPPASIPTLGEWGGLVMAALLLAGFGWQRRHPR